MKRFSTSLIVLMFSLYLIIKLFFVLVMPGKDFLLLPAIPIFFITFGLLALKFAYAKKDISPMILLSAKMIKTLLSIFIMMIYIVVKGEESIPFLISYSLFFVTYLVYETIVLTIINKKKP